MFWPILWQEFHYQALGSRSLGEDHGDLDAKASRMTRSPGTTGVKQWAQLRRPYRYALALVLACASLIALILLYPDRSVSVKDKLTQIGTGLAASIIFAIIYTVLANREYAELIRVEIAGQLTNHLNNILGEMNQLNQLFLPTDQYPATMDFDTRFNRAITFDLCRSNTYFFRGTSAKYIPARLRMSAHRLELTQVILLDPHDRGAIEARAQDRRRRPEYDGKQIAEIASEMRGEILQALIALFDCREHCAVEIGLSNVTSPVRIEIFDESLYTSFYRSRESERSTHPETARFGKESQIYQIFKDECRRQMQMALSIKRFTTRDTDDDLVAYLTSLGFVGIGPAELGEQRASYKTFITPFSNALSTIGVSG